MDRNLRRLAVSTLSLLAAATTAANAPGAASIEAYGRLPSIEDLAMSMDGAKLAMVHTLAEQRVLSIVVPDEDKCMSEQQAGALGGLR